MHKQHQTDDNRDCILLLCKQNCDMPSLSIEGIYSKCCGVLLRILPNSAQLFGSFVQSLHYPEDDVVEVQSMPKSVHIFLKRIDIKFVRLSLCKFAGQPNRETQQSTKTFAAVIASWFCIGTASYHFENLFPKSKIYLKPSLSGKLSKNICLVSKNIGPAVICGLFDYHWGFFFHERRVLNRWYSG